MNTANKLSAILAVALFAVLPSFAAATWTGADGNTYTALEHLQGNGNGYVLTGITPLCTDTVKTRFKTPSSLTTLQALFCARGSGNAQSFVGCMDGGNSQKLRIDRNSTVARSSATAFAPSTQYLLEADFNDGAVKLNGSAVSITLGTGPYYVGSTLVLFALCNNSTISASYKGQHTLYYFELYDSSGTLKYCLLPAKNASDKAGLYDTVHGVFYEQEGNDFVAAARVVVGSGKKWTGRGSDNKMSTPENWEGGTLPAEGQDLDFTLAPPLATIDANISGTYGKLWIDDGDIPNFTGSLTVSACNYRAKVASNPSIVFLVANYTWNGGAAANWSDADVWTLDNEAATWADNNNAIFNTANAAVTLDADATAGSLVFNAATIIATNGTDAATLTVPSVSVVSDVSATISAPTAGTLAKTGAGTLTLESSRSAATTLSEGRLVMSGSGTTLDWTNFTLGTDVAKPVTLCLEDGAALASTSAEYNFGNVANITSTICKAGGDWTRSGITRIGRAAGANTTFVNEAGDLTFSDFVTIGGQTSADPAASSELAIAGGTVSVTLTGSGAPFISVGSHGSGIVTVTNNAALNVAANMALAIHSGSGTLNVSDGGTATIGTDIILGFSNSDAGTGTVNLGTGGTVVADTIRVASYGTGVVNFDGGTLKADAAGTLIQSSNRMTINVSASGGTIDNDGKNVTIAQTMTGAGGMTFSGSGTTTISTNQSYTGTTTVSNGMTLAVSGVTFAGALALEAGSTLNLASYTPGVTPVAASALTLPESGTVALTLNGGAFTRGVYAVCSASGVTDAAGAKFAPSTGGESVAWSVSDGMLVLTVGSVDPGLWTGLGDGVSMSDGANWAGNAVPAAGASIDLSGISADTTIIADADRTFGAVTMGTSVITFTNAMAATLFSDTSKIAVAADSTVTIDGDLVFSSGTETKYITYTVAEGGVFRVTGRIVATGFSGSGYLVPSYSQAFSGTIAASGLFNDCSKDGSGYPRFIIVRNSDSYNPTWVIGSDGLAGTGGFYINPHNNSSATIVAESDFVDSANILNNNGSLFIDAAGREVTLGTNTLSGTGGVYGAGATTIVGGRVIANYDVDNLTSNASYKNPLFTVKSGATLVLNLGANIGTGLLTVEDGGALEVAESGTVTLNGDLSLTNGAALAFNFTERSIAPQLAIASGKSVVFAEGESTNITVKVSGAANFWPAGGEKVLTTCGGFDADGVTVSLAAGAPDWVNDISVNGDGNIVLDVKPMGMIVIVQ